MEKTFSKIEHRQKRHRRVRAKIIGDAKTPRLCVFRSNQHVYAQLIDDQTKKVLGVISDFDNKGKATVKTKDGKELKGKMAIAFKTGEAVAAFAKSKNIEKVLFDRGGYKYHGRVQALADGARAGGLQF